MENKQKKLSYQLLAVISTPKLADKTAEMFAHENLPLQYRFNAEGTAPSEVMDLLGLGSIDKCIILSMIPKERSAAILKKLHTELQLDTVNSGIAFTIPINGASNLILRLLTQTADENTIGSARKDDSMTEVKYALVAAIVNRGFSGDVMEAAKSAGARGGSVIHSRRIDNEVAASFWGLNAQEEQEIVLIIVEAEDRVPIMQSIGEKCGMKSDAKGIVTSIPIDSVIGI